MFGLISCQCKFTIFLLAVFEKRLTLVEMILAAAPNRKKLLSQRDLYGNYAIHLAVMQNAGDVFSLLLQHGASKESVNFVLQRTKPEQNDETPLALAKELGMRQIEEQLVGQPATIESSAHHAISGTVLMEPIPEPIFLSSKLTKVFLVSEKMIGNYTADYPLFAAHTTKFREDLIRSYFA